MANVGNPELNVCIGGIPKDTSIDDVTLIITKTFDVSASNFQVEILSVRDNSNGTIQWRYTVSADATTIHKITSNKDKLPPNWRIMSSEGINASDAITVTLSYQPDEARNTNKYPVKFLECMAPYTGMDIKLKVVKYSSPHKYETQDVINLDVRNTKSSHCDAICGALYAVDTYWPKYCLCLTTDYNDTYGHKDYRGPKYYKFPRECGKELSICK